MKLKLAAVLSFLVIGLAGCSANDKAPTTANANAPAANAPAATAPATSTSATTSQANPNMVEASADPSATSGGTKEGCKCSAVGMSCNHKEGEKGCCGGKDGTCSSRRDGVAKCCTPEKDGGACCSTAKSMAMKDMKDMKGMPEKKADAPAEATTKKS